ncbi:hypothetical protein AB0L00_44465 [Actinoallomurus sp. NPDC052308]|uniref:hypothetical protein n=1 Tax=Actinoallomurus sp. NPDC052308 TaxID=3155530 RepID=UPI0034214E9F
MEAAGSPGPRDTRVDQKAVFPRGDPGGTDPALWLARLRREFPHWGILHDPFASAWIAVRGRAHLEVTRTAFELRDRLRSHAGRPERS